MPCIVVADRQKARMFELRADNITEKMELEFGKLPYKGKSDGFMGYDAGHRERHKENEVMTHFKQLADSIQMLMQGDKCESLLIGCRDETWPEIEPHLNTGLKQKLVERFTLDPACRSAEEVRRITEQILNRKRMQEQQRLVREVIGQASRNETGGRGA